MWEMSGQSSFGSSAGVDHACNHSAFSLIQQICTEHLLCTRHRRDRNKNLCSRQTYILVGKGRQNGPVGKVCSMLNDDKYNVEKQRKRAGEAQVMVAEGSSFKIGD